MRLVPSEAVLVLGIDLKALRGSPMVRQLLTDEQPRARDRVTQMGFDPARDLEQVVVAAGNVGHRLEFVVLLRGRLERRQILSALQERTELSRRSQRGFTLYRDPSRAGPLLLFPGPRTMIVVSEGYCDALLSRLLGQGRSVLDTPLGVRARTVRQSSAWVTTRLSLALRDYVASRTGWAALKGVELAQGDIKPQADRLDLRLDLQMDAVQGARLVQHRVQQYSRGAPNPPRVTRDGRRVSLRLSLTLAQLRGIRKVAASMLR